MRKLLVLTVFVGLLTICQVASARSGPWLSRQQALRSAHIASDRWLGRPGYVRCVRETRRRFLCSTLTYGQLAGQLEHTTCSPACFVRTHIYGMVVELTRPRLVLVRVRKHHWGITAWITYAAQRSSGTVSGTG